MRVFNVPVSAPFLRTVIAALVDGRLVDGFEARANPERLAEATLYLPTRRAERMAREMFLDVLNTDAVILPRIVALGDIDEDELAFAEEAEPLGGGAPLDIPPKLGELERRLTLARLVAAWAKSPVAVAAGGRRPGLDAGAGRRPRAADGRHGDARRRLERARRAGAGSARPILAAHARIPEDRPRRPGPAISPRSAGSSRRRGATC